MGWIIACQTGTADNVSRAFLNASSWYVVYSHGYLFLSSGANGSSSLDIISGKVPRKKRLQIRRVQRAWEVSNCLFHLGARTKSFFTHDVTCEFQLLFCEYHLTLVECHSILLGRSTRAWTSLTYVSYEFENTKMSSTILRLFCILSNSSTTRLH